uniref:Uncharacterized protein n=1 Tax=Alexandrium catenella TaxID=2925 RepID=A0A7S1S2C0_ALECA
MGGRQRISSKRVTGQLLQWKGKYGWIRPTEPVKHPKASMHGGKVYIGIEDIEGPELNNNCMVNFMVYADETGLGAMQCRRAKGGEKPAKGAGGKGGVIKTNLKQSSRPPLPMNTPQKGQGKRASKGVGKGAVKGAGKAGKRARADSEEAEDQGPPPPDKAARTRLIPLRIVGKLVRWRGSIGWIRPVEKLDLEEFAAGAPKHRRGIYLHEVDVKDGHEMFQGAQVSFFLYSDDDGLGAEQCMLTKDQPAPEEREEKLLAKPKAKFNEKGRGKGEARVSEKGKGKGKGEARGKEKGGGKGVKKTSMVEKERLRRRGRRGRKNRDKEDGEEGEEKGEKGKKREGGPDLPRERVSDMPVMGEVVESKGKWAWLRCAEDVDHELAPKHDNKIYIHSKDVLDGTELSVGQTFEFHVYADSSGLGAEEAITTKVTAT